MGQTPSGQQPEFLHRPDDAQTLERALNSKVAKAVDQERPVPDTTDFTVIGALGIGGFGLVLEVEHNDTAERYAVKILHSVPSFSCLLDPVRTVQRRERKIQIAANFEFILKLRWHFRKQDYLLFVLDIAPYGTVLEVFGGRQAFRAKEHEILFIVAQLVLALEYLHNSDIAHRDVKADNIFVFGDGYVKLGDFGLAIKLKGKKTFGATGTLSTMAPEVARNAYRDCGGYGVTADWYSLGATIFHLAQGPASLDRWTKIPPHRTLNIVMSGEMFPVNQNSPVRGFSSRGLMFLKGLLRTNPQERLGVAYSGVKTLKKNVWLANYDFPTLYAKRYKSPLIGKPMYKADPNWKDNAWIPQAMKNLFPEGTPLSEQVAAHYERFLSKAY